MKFKHYKYIFLFVTEKFVVATKEIIIFGKVYRYLKFTTISVYIDMYIYTRYICVCESACVCVNAPNDIPEEVNK